jgi:hypothetical protein
LAALLSASGAATMDPQSKAPALPAGCYLG